MAEIFLLSSGFLKWDYREGGARFISKIYMTRFQRQPLEQEKIRWIEFFTLIIVKTLEHLWHIYPGDGKLTWTKSLS